MSLPPSNGHLVLITGVNGYIASWTAKQFLDAGYSVRGTTRSLTSTKDIEGVLQDYVKAERFMVVQVKDITADGAFDEAIKGCHAIVHMASPVSQFFTDPEPIIHTSVAGTHSILASALEYAQSNPSTPFKSIILTSSTAAIMSPKDGPYTYTEDDWNSFSPAEVAEHGKNTEGVHIYRASKVASERAFWDFQKEHQKEISFTMTTVNPTWVIGPPLVLPSSPDKINETVRATYTILSGQPIPPPLGGSSSFVDVRDVGRLHVLAVQKAEVADGQRYIACAGLGAEQAIADILNRKYVHAGGSRSAWFREKGRTIEVGNPGEGYNQGYTWPNPAGVSVDGSKVTKDFGLEYIGYEKAILDAARVFETYL